MSDAKPVKKEAAMPVGLDLMRAPFPANQISKLPKPTKQQTEAVRNDFKVGVRCEICGLWHHPKVVHLDYVGHAALTDRLLDCDPSWNWEPLAFTQTGTPLTDENGGMWIRLTVCGVTRFGYGHPDGKKGGDAIKEVIGDALRNAAMRFGAALDLWHKGDLHADEAEAVVADDVPQFDAAAARDRIKRKIEGAQTLEELGAAWGDEKTVIHEIGAVSAPMKAELVKAKDTRKTELTEKSAADLGGDEIPY
jgi:hypothetical protein